MTVIACILSKIKTAKNVVRQMSKNPPFRTPFNSQHYKSPKHLRNLHESNFVRVLHHYEENFLGTCLS